METEMETTKLSIDVVGDKDDVVEMVT